MDIRLKAATLFLKTVIRIICKVDASDLTKIPLSGPGIIVINHINFLEVPLIQVCIVPRKMHGLVKRETWNNPFLRFFLNTYEAVPVHRGGANLESFGKVRDLLTAGDYICIAPEGTRSGNGVLQKGRPGIVSIASMSKIPVIPVVHTGGEAVWENLRHFRKTRITFKVGKPFYIKQEQPKTREIRQQITSEVMYQLAELLPDHMKGIYADVSGKSTNYLLFE